MSTNTGWLPLTLPPDSAPGSDTNVLLAWRIKDGPMAGRWYTAPGVYLRDFAVDDDEFDEFDEGTDADEPNRITGFFVVQNGRFEDDDLSFRPTDAVLWHPFPDTPTDVDVFGYSPEGGGR